MHTQAQRRANDAGPEATAKLAKARAEAESQLRVTVNSSTIAPHFYAFRYYANPSTHGTDFRSQTTSADDGVTVSAVAAAAAAAGRVLVPLPSVTEWLQSKSNMGRVVSASCSSSQLLSYSSRVVVSYSAGDAALCCNVGCSSQEEADAEAEAVIAADIAREQMELKRASDVSKGTVHCYTVASLAAYGPSRATAAYDARHGHGGITNSSGPGHNNTGLNSSGVCTTAESEGDANSSLLQLNSRLQSQMQHEQQRQLQLLDYHQQRLYLRQQQQSASDIKSSSWFLSRVKSFFSFSNDNNTSSGCLTDGSSGDRNHGKNVTYQSHVAASALGLANVFSQRANLAVGGGPPRDASGGLGRIDREHCQIQQDEEEEDGLYKGDKGEGLRLQPPLKSHQNGNLQSPPKSQPYSRSQSPSSLPPPSSHSGSRALLQRQLTPSCTSQSTASPLSRVSHIHSDIVSGAAAGGHPASSSSLRQFEVELTAQRLAATDGVIVIEGRRFYTKPIPASLLPQQQQQQEKP